MQLVIGSTYESSRGFGRLLYLGETHDIDGYLPTFRTTKGDLKFYGYYQLPGALVEFAPPTVSRADELIACLEVEIAKRDVELERLRAQAIIDGLLTNKSTSKMLSDLKAEQQAHIIDGLRGEVEVMTQNANNYSRMFEECAEQRDQLAWLLREVIDKPRRPTLEEVQRIDAALSADKEGSDV